VYAYGAALGWNVSANLLADPANVFCAVRYRQQMTLAGLNQDRDRLNREELRQRIAAALPFDGTVECLPALHLYRASRSTARISGVSNLSFCVIAQGAKEVLVGNRTYRYDTQRYLLATAELPVTGCVVDASPELPYLSLRLDLDLATVASVMVEAGVPTPPGASEAKALVVSVLEPGLLDAVVRLMRLVDHPPESRAFAPLVKREIILRLLMGEQGVRLRSLPPLGGHSDRIAQAVNRLRRDIRQPLRIESLARELGMSSSGFHHQFKAVTDMSPLQYLKGLRLHEARRLMLDERLDATTAGLRVGYDDASHFSRDYKRLFGEAPIRDVERLRTMAVAD
jgi:AraC-like DNA-binding protein